MKRRRVTLSLEAGAARLVVFENGQVASWDTVELKSALGDALPDGIEQQIRQLMQSRGIKRNRAIIGFYHPSLLIRNLELPRMAHRYVNKVVAQELKNAIPFSPEEVDLFSQSSPNGNGCHVLALGVPTDILERYSGALKAAAIRPAALYPRSLALAQAAGEQNAIIVDMEPDHADIILIARGLPRLIYHSTVRLSAEDGFEGIQVLAVEIGRTIEFYKASEPEAPEGVVIPLGRVASEALVSRLTNSSPWEVKPFKPPFECPVDFPVADYAVNLGLALAAQGRDQAAAFRPAINVLPVRYRPSPFPWKLAAICAFLLILMIAVPFISQRVDNKIALVSSLSNRLDGYQAQVHQERLRLQEIGKLQQSTASVQALDKQLEARLGELAASRAFLTQRLQTVATDSLPDGAALVSVSHAASGLSLRGQARSYDDALRYAAQLRSSGLFAGADLLEVQSGTEGVSFRIMATYIEDGARSPP